VTHPALVVLHKEIVDALRDRRAFALAMVYALLGPLFLIPILRVTADSLNRRENAPVVVAMDGAAHAPSLVGYLREHAIEVKPFSGDPFAEVKSGREDVVVVVTPEYAAELREGHAAVVRVVTDTSRGTAGPMVRRVARQVELYGRVIGQMRLLARGIDPQAASGLALEIDDVATPSSSGAILLSGLPMFLLLAVFAGGAHVAIDVTAGERERGSMEPLFATPLTVRQLALGKLGAVIVFSAATLLVSDVAFSLVISLAPPPQIAGMRLELGPMVALRIFAGTAPLVLPVAALQILVASRSKTVKEAQTATMLLLMIPMLPGVALALSPFAATNLTMLVPSLAQAQLITSSLRGAPLEGAHLAIAVASTTALGALLTLVATSRRAWDKVVAAR